MPRRRGLSVLLLATLLCYAVGYPLALVGNSGVGWILVAAGGPLLIAVGVVFIRSVHATAEAARRSSALSNGEPSAQP